MDPHFSNRIENLLAQLADRIEEMMVEMLKLGNVRKHAETDVAQAMSVEQAAQLLAQLADRIEDMMVEMLKRGNVRKHAETDVAQAMSVEQAAQYLGRKPFTVREWCRNGRIKANRATARGPYAEWRIPIDSIRAYQAHGLLPRPKRRE